MSINKANGEYQVLSPWANVDPLPLRGITPRVTELAGKKIGLLTNLKGAAKLILDEVEKKLKERYPSCETSWFRGQAFSVSELEKERVLDFREWINGVDTVIVANAD